MWFCSISHCLPRDDGPGDDEVRKDFAMSETPARRPRLSNPNGRQKPVGPEGPKLQTPRVPVVVDEAWEEPLVPNLEVPNAATAERSLKRANKVDGDAGRMRRILSTASPARGQARRSQPQGSAAADELQYPSQKSMELARRHAEHLQRARERCRQLREAYRPSVIEIPEDCEIVVRTPCSPPHPEDCSPDASTGCVDSVDSMESMSPTRLSGRKLMDDNRRVSEFLDAGGFRHVNDRRTRIFRTYTPLHTAIEQNDRELVRCLLEKGADVSMTVNGVTAYELAERLADRDGHFDSGILALLPTGAMPSSTEQLQSTRVVQSLFQDASQSGGM